MNVTIFIERLKTYDLRSNESRDHYHVDGYLVPIPRCGFRFEVVSQVLDLNLTLSVYVGMLLSRKFCRLSTNV